MRSPAVKTTALGLLAAALALSGCAVSSNHLAPGYGREVRAAVAAQIADPDAQYKGDPAPASSGMRTAGAQQRYDGDRVRQPASSSTSTVTVGGASGAGATSQ